MKVILAGADRLARAAFALSAVLVMCLAVFVFYEVVARYVVGRPTIWVNEVSGYLLVATTFLAGGWVLRQGGHVRMEMLEEMTGPRGRAALALFGNLIAWRMPGHLLDADTGAQNTPERSKKAAKRKRKRAEQRQAQVAD